MSDMLIFIQNNLYAPKIISLFTNIYTFYMLFA